jgi:hypothetical protein
MSFLFFTKSEKRKTEQVLPGCWYQWEWRGGGEMMKEDEHGANTVYTCMYMEK